MKTKKITFFSKDLKNVKKIIYDSFPSYEIIPSFSKLILFSTFSKNFNLYAYYENKKLIAILYSAENKKYISILFFAIKKEFRSQGYGSKILKSIIKNTDKNIVLYIEKLEKENNNYDQRLKRYYFYQKNGFKLTDYQINEKGNFYNILTNKKFNKEDYQKLLNKIMLFSEKRKIVKNSITRL